MCGLCGLLGTTHWSETTPNAESAGASQRPPRGLRMERIGLINRALEPFALRVDDFHGQAYLLSSPTGKTEMASDLMTVWTLGANMLGRPLDPLDEAVLDRMDRHRQPDPAAHLNDHNDDGSAE